MVDRMPPNMIDTEGGTPGQVLGIVDPGGGVAWRFQPVDALAVKDEGTTLTSATTSLNFVGAGVVATSSAGNVTVNIAGSSGGELAVMDGITNPPELAYNDAGDDYVYLD